MPEQSSENNLKTDKYSQNDPVCPVPNHFESSVSAAYNSHAATHIRTVSTDSAPAHNFFSTLHSN